MQLAGSTLRLIIGLVGLLLFVLVILFLVFNVVLFLIPLAIGALLLGYFFRMLNKMKRPGKKEEYLEAKYREVK